MKRIILIIGFALPHLTNVRTLKSMKSNHLQLLLTSTAALATLLAIAPTSTAATKTPASDTAHVAPLKGGFADGYRDGYKKANPMSMSPIPPIAPIGRNSYEDGFGLGYAQGMIDKR
jgi:hypothetical protein